MGLPHRGDDVTPRLSVNDHESPENSFTRSEGHIFPLLWEVGDLYGMDVVSDNWDALINYQAITIDLDNGNKVTIQLHRK